MEEPAGAVGSSDGDKRWERPWTVDEIRREADKWSLAGDAGLLLHIKDFSQKMIGRIHETNNLLDDLLHETKVSSVRVDNVFNDFVMLANTQFVENRVFEEDVTQEPEPEKTPEPEKSREQREAELIPRIKEAIQHGLAVVDDMFEVVRVDIGADSDSEDEINQGESIMKVKNPYAERPLPHLIGTEAFMREDDLGLREESSEESESEEEAEEEESESDKKDSESEFSESESEGEKREIIPRKHSQKREPSSSESDGDLFGREDKSEDDFDEEDNDHETQKPKRAESGGGRDFASELARKIGAAPPQPGSDQSEHDDDDWDDQPKQAKTTKPAEKAHKEHHHHKKEKHDHGKSSKTNKKTKKEESDDDEPLFAPPEDDNVMTWNDGGGLFSGGGGLFDDESGGGLFDDITDTRPKPKLSIPKEKEKPKEPEPKAAKKAPAGGVSLFAGDDDDLFGSSPSEPAPAKSVPAKPTAAPTTKKAAVGGLFGGSDDDSDGDLFAASASKTKSAPKAKEAPKVDLFGDDDAEEDDGNDLFAPPKQKSSAAAAAPPVVVGDKKKSLVGAVSMFGGGSNPLAVAAITNRRPPASDDEDRWSDDNRSTSSRTSSTRPNNLKPADRLDRGGSPASKQDRSSSLSSNSNSLFADEPEEAPKIEPKPKKPVVDPFQDENDGDDLFGTAPKITTKPRKNTGLFIEDDDDDAGDLFAKKTEPSKPAGKPAGQQKSLFSPDDEDKDLFGNIIKPKGNEPKASAAVAPKSKEPVKKKVVLSLFDDDDDDEGGDLFATPSAPPANQKPAAASSANQKPAARETLSPPKDIPTKNKPRKSLFADDDVLFGSAPADDDEEPTIDLFSAQSPLTPSPGQPGFEQKSTKPSQSAPAKVTVQPASSAQPASFPPLTLDGVTTTSSRDDVTDGRDDVTPTQNQSATSVTEGAKKTTSPASHGGRRPTGGVSLFGGVDVFGIKSKSPESSSEKTEPKEARSSVSPVRSPLPSRPGVTTTEQAVSFDQPVNAETLHSVNKERAKVATKRRPPTRKGRQSLITDSTSSPLDSSSTLTNSAEHNLTNGDIEERTAEQKRPSLLEISKTASSTVDSKTRPKLDLPDSPDDLFAQAPKKSDSTDLFSTPSGGGVSDGMTSSQGKSRDKMDGADIFGSIGGGSSNKKGAAKTKDLFDDSPGGDLFGSSLPQSSKTRFHDDDDIFADDTSKTTKSKPEADDIFSTPSAPLTNQSSVTDNKKVKNIDSDDDDIFKSEPKAKPKPEPTMNKSAKSNAVKDPFDDDDDLFATPAAKPEVKVTTKDDDLFKDDTDIFADVPAASAKTKKKKTEKSKSLFNDDVDDIFATPSSKSATPTKKTTKTKKKTKQQSQAAAASIFDDEAPSIFDDPLSAMQS